MLFYFHVSALTFPWEIEEIPVNIWFWFYFHVNALTFPWEIEEISVIIWFFILLSQLETSVGLVADYSKYPRIVAGRNSI